jgi:hypothetical protein
LRWGILEKKIVAHLSDYFKDLKSTKDYFFFSSAFISAFASVVASADATGASSGAATSSVVASVVAFSDASFLPPQETNTVLVAKTTAYVKNTFFILIEIKG